MWIASETEAYPSAAHCANSDFAVVVSIERNSPQITQITRIRSKGELSTDYTDYTDFITLPMSFRYRIKPGMTDPESILLSL